MKNAGMLSMLFDAVVNNNCDRTFGVHPNDEA
jgi:hypothetical protein